MIDKLNDPTTETLTVREAALALGVRLDMLYWLLWGGQLAGEKVNGRWRVSRAAVEERIERLSSDGRSKSYRPANRRPWAERVDGQ